MFGCERCGSGRGVRYSRSRRGEEGSPVGGHYAVSTNRTDRARGLEERDGRTVAKPWQGRIADRWGSAIGTTQRTRDRSATTSTGATAETSVAAAGSGSGVYRCRYGWSRPLAEPTSYKEHAVNKLSSSRRLKIRASLLKSAGDFGRCRWESAAPRWRKRRSICGGTISQNPSGGLRELRDIVRRHMAGFEIRLANDIP